MKVAYILPNLRETGPIIVVQNIVRCLINHVEDICVFYLAETDKPIDFCCHTERITYFKSIDFDCFDIIHCHCAKSDLYAYFWKWKIRKAKILTTIHQDTYITESYRLGKVIGYIYTTLWLRIQNKFDGIICISNQIKDIYSKYLSTDITRIYNGIYCEKTESVDAEILETINKLKQNYKVLGTYALVTKRKGLEQVIEFVKENEDYAFVIIGDGPEKENLLAMVKVLGLSDRVLFFDYIDHPYLYLNDIDIYTMVSYSEGFGLAMVEAALNKKAIVCSNLPSFHEIFGDDDACFFELRNKESLSFAIKRAYKDREYYSTRAYLRAQNFTYTQMGNNHLRYYEQILI